MEEKYDVIIIGSGAAGLSAALYSGRYKMRTLVISGEFGGETAIAGSIENYPGVKAIDGYELMKIMKDQTTDLGVEIADGMVEKIEKSGDIFTVSTKDKTYTATSVIISIGSKRRHLGLDREEEFVGKGVHYCWTCDGPLFGGKTVAMVGGGDSSVKGVNFLAEYAEKIYLIARGDALISEPVNLEQMEKLGDKVEVLLENEVTELVGKDKVEKIILSKEPKELIIDGLFVEIGFDPDTVLAKQIGVELDERNYIKVSNEMKTNIEGIFAAGDATNHFGSFKQDITAAATGAMAATSAYEYYKLNK